MYRSQQLQSWAINWTVSKIFDWQRLESVFRKCCPTSIQHLPPWFRNWFALSRGIDVTVFFLSYFFCFKKTERRNYFLDFLDREGGSISALHSTYGFLSSSLASQSNCGQKQVSYFTNNKTFDSILTICFPSIQDLRDSNASKNRDAKQPERMADAGNANLLLESQGKMDFLDKLSWQYSPINNANFQLSTTSIWKEIERQLVSCCQTIGNFI